MKKYIFLFLFSIFLFLPKDTYALQQLSCTSTETVGTDAYNKQCSNVLLSKAEFASCGGYTCNAWHNTNKNLEYPLGQYFTINAPYLYNDAYYPSIIYRIGSSDYLHYDFDKDSYYSIVYTFKFDHDVNINEDIDLTNNFNVQSYKGLLYSSSTDVFSDYHVNLEKFQSSESEYYVYLYFDFTPKDTINKLKFYVGNENFDESEDFILTTDVPNSQVTRSYYYDFAVYDEYQYADIPTHGGGGIKFDDPNAEDEEIFNSLQQCDPLDIGCHVSNILDMLKSIFIRIRNGINGIVENIISVFQGDNGVDDKLEEEKEATKEQTETIKDKDTSESQEQASGFFGNFENDDFGLSDIITMPLSFIQGLSNSTCYPLNLPLPFVEQNATLPCMTSIYQQHFGAFLSIYQIITTGFISYWVCINIFRMVQGFKNPDSDEIEVMDL